MCASLLLSVASVIGAASAASAAGAADASACKGIADACEEVGLKIVDSKS